MVENDGEDGDIGGVSFTNFLLIHVQRVMASMLPSWRACPVASFLLLEKRPKQFEESTLRQKLFRCDLFKLLIFD